MEKDNQITEKNDACKFDRGITISLILFAILQLFVIFYKDFDQFNVTTNTISYIQVAQKYVDGDFWNAVNGAFGPLESWLLVPLLMVGFGPVLSIGILNLLSGISLLIGIRALSFKFFMSTGIRNVISFTAAAIVLYFATMDHVADLLVTCALVYYLNAVMDKDYYNNVRIGALCGLFCAAGYFSKSYILPFFFLHYLTVNVIYYFRSRKNTRNLVMNVITGFSVFAILTVPWVVALSSKYGKFTIGNSGTYNYRILSPDAEEPAGNWWDWSGWHMYTRMGQPVYYYGFLPPSNDTALSSWEDFSSHADLMKPWSPFDSMVALKHQIKLIVRNIYYTIGILEGSFSLFASIIILGYLLVYIVPFNKSIFYKNGIVVLFTFLLYPLGYILLHPHERYLWLLCILLLLMGGQLIHLLSTSAFFNETRKNILITLFVISFVALPLKNVISANNPDKEIYQDLSKYMKPFQSLTGKVASNDNYSESIKLFFYRDMTWRYYGQAKKGIDEHELKDALEEYGIDYYLVWTDKKESSRDSLMTGYKEMTNGTVPGIKIYSLKHRL